MFQRQGTNVIVINLREPMPYQLSTSNNDAIEPNQWPTLVLFCKRPKLHQGKQRIAQTITAEKTLIVAQALLECAIEDSHAWRGPVVIACSHDDDVEWAQSLNEKALIMTQLPQGISGNLGQRLNYVDHVLRVFGHQKIITIGTDAPMLTAQHFSEAARALNKHEVVLSHADDGGVVIMANAAPWPNIIDLPWSTEYLSQALSRRCRERELTVHYMTPGYDIDYVADIKKLISDLKGDQRPARKKLLNILNQLFIFSGVINHA